jgi:hypothetical protein
LEDQISEDHLLRLIDQHIDLSFVRERLKNFYSGTGRPSIDPEVLLRLLLLGYLYGITSERRLLEEVRMHRPIVGSRGWTSSRDSGSLDVLQEPARALSSVGSVSGGVRRNRATLSGGWSSGRKESGGGWNDGGSQRQPAKPSTAGAVAGSSAGRSRISSITKIKGGLFGPPLFKSGPTSDALSTLAPVFRRLWRVPAEGLA